MLRCSEDPAESETSSPKAGEKKSSPSEVALRPRNQLEIIAVTHTFQGFFSNAGNPRQNPFFFFSLVDRASPIPMAAHAAVRRLDAAISIHTVMFLRSSQRQTRSGSRALDQTHHLSSYFCTWPPLSNTPSHSCPRPPPPPPRGTCDWLACCRHSCHGSPSVLINAVDLPKSCLPQQLARLLARPDTYDVARSAANRR